MEKMQKRPAWKLEYRPISELKPYDKNPRVITEEGLKQLEKSFNDIGNAQPININVDGTILSGHARYQQLLKEGVSEVAVYVPDRILTPKQEESVIIRMNKNIAGEWDFDMLANEFEIEDLKDWGFNDIDFPSITKLGENELDDEESPKESENKKYKIEVQFPNDMEMRDLYDDLISKGYLVRIL